MTGRFFALGTFGLLCVGLAAQTPVFRQHSMEDIAPVSFACMFQDSKGWMWFGGKSGLFRYDGLSFEEFPLDSSLRGHVSALFEWRGELWAGFSSGCIGRAPLNKIVPAAPAAFDRRQVRMSRWEPQEGCPERAVTGFAADLSGNLWFGSYGEGLYCFTGERLYQFDRDDGMGSDDVYAVVADAQGRIWAATDAGISICAFDEQRRKNVERLTVADGLTDEIVTALALDKSGNIWIGAQERGIFRYNTSLGKIDWASPDWRWGAVKSLCVFGRDMVWAGTERNGPVQISPSRNMAQALPDAHPLSRGKSLCLLKDREGLMWSLFEKGGIYTANVRFGVLGVPLSNVQAVLATRDGRLWAGGPEGIVVMEKDGSEAFRPPAHIRNVLALCESPADGHVWVGTFDQGVFMIDPKGRVIQRHATDKGLLDNNVLSICGNSARVFLATLSGVMAVNPKTNEVEPVKGLHNKYVYKILCDRTGGRGWVASDGSGLLVWESGQLRHFGEAEGKPIKTVFNLAQDARGNIWFYADKLGLLQCDGQNVRFPNGSKRLQRKTGIALGVTADGLIAIGYDDGFDLLNAEGTGHVARCTPESGAPAAEFNLNAVCTDADGRLWFGTRSGLLQIADLGEDFLHDPQLDIISTTVLSEAIDRTELTEFAHDQNYFVFYFQGLWYTQPKAVRYRYRLEGFDPTWTISKDPVASYPRLPPGRYTFRLQASEHGDFETAPQVAWSFTVKSPLWARPWFIALALALLGWGGWQLVRSRERRQAREAQLKRENIVSQYEALKSQMDPHFLFNSFNTLIAVIEENPRSAVEYAERLSDFFRKIMTYREQDFISLSEERDLLRDYFFLLSKRYENGLVLIDRLEGQAGLVAPLSLQMLAENAVKHNIIAQNKPLTLEFYIDSDDYVVVRNNLQPKIRPEPGTEFGLQSLANRYRLLGRRPIAVEDDGNTFTVKIPLYHEH